ncbi:TolC family protein [Botrimarina mediterranea]|uniref:Cobalt-zinc-cadmium resistance protein CzcC n=1 Tax=Botrimarina mediterranea TaxID=2528022 RepID=A0A518KC54_9BACT|nr:TolC family protein [Botrimarina mediterranea]QDV75383.1 Cobalt-zinc-cadmium resistance protein CzcC precursor [Botrimarina mediterranea]
MKTTHRTGHSLAGVAIVGMMAIAAMAPPIVSAQESAGTLRNPLDPSPPIERLPPPAALTSAEASEGGLSLKDLEAIALSQNPSIARVYALVGAAKGAWVQAGLPPNPSLGYDGQQLGSGGLAEQHGVAFGQEIVTGGKLRLSRSVAQKRIEVAEQQFAAQRQRVLTDVRVAFYQVLIAQRQIELAEELIRVSGEGTKTVDALFRSKEVGRVDMLQAQLESEQAQIALQSARNRHEAAWRSLAAVIGDPTFSIRPLSGDPAAPAKEIEFDIALSRLRRSSPEVSAAVAELDRARFAVDRARVEPIPNINFMGLVNWQDNGIGGKADGGVAVTVPIPLWNRNQGAIAQAEREVAAARQAIDQVELSLQQRLAPVYETYADARNQVERYRETILPAADEALTLSRKMYGAGEANYLNVLTAQRTYAQTKSNYLDAALRLRISEVVIEGMLLSGSLDTGQGVDQAYAPSTAGREMQTTPLFFNR